MVSTLVFLGLGLALLFVGADILIRGATGIARQFGVSTLVVGLTVVAFGTSAPELFVSVNAAWRGVADLAVGNVIGSNIFNILMIIGLSSLIAPMEVQSAVIRRDMPIMLAVLVLFYLAGMNGVIGRLEGGGLFIGILSYVYYNYRIATHSEIHELANEDLEQADDSSTNFSLQRNLLFVGFGLIAMVFGSNWIVENATVIAKAFHVSDLVIGITLVAIGTSLPEVATTVVAAYRHESDLALGNGIGSNVFNVLAVIGLTGLILPLTVSQRAIEIDMPFMLISCFAVWPLMMFRRRLGRFEGLAMVAVYGAYVASLFVGQPV